MFEHVFKKSYFSKVKLFSSDCLCFPESLEKSFVISGQSKENMEMNTEKQAIFPSYNELVNYETY